MVLPKPVTTRLMMTDAMSPLTLSEWETREVEVPEPVALRIGRAPYSKWLSVSPATNDGRWVLRAKQFVGAFEFDGLKVVVRPKIPLRNLFLMLEVGLPADAWLPEKIEYAEDQDLLSALISFFARTPETTMARGLYHFYRHVDDELFTLRGRIDFTRQFRLGGLRVPMACSYDDFTADVDENRYLKAAMRRALRVVGVPLEDRRRLMRLLVALEEVDDMPLEASDVDRIGFTRLNEHYWPALRLARLILENLTLRDKHGDNTASSFMLDMNDLFERFVSERLLNELSGHLVVKSQESSHLDDDKLVGIRPDLLLKRSDAIVGVAEIKYKLAKVSTDYNRDYYQLLAYTTALDLPRGTLIYCVDVSTDPESGWQVDPSRVTKSTIIVKHAGKQLDVVAIDLSGSPNDIRQQFTALSNHLLQCAISSDTLLQEIRHSKESAGTRLSSAEILSARNGDRR